MITKKTKFIEMPNNTTEARNYQKRYGKRNKEKMFRKKLQKWWSTQISEEKKAKERVLKNAGITFFEKKYKKRKNTLENTISIILVPIMWSRNLKK